jgi:hypothetical protein
MAAFLQVNIVNNTVFPLGTIIYYRLNYKIKKISILLTILMIQKHTVNNNSVL